MTSTATNTRASRLEHDVRADHDGRSVARIAWTLAASFAAVAALLGSDGLLLTDRPTATPPLLGAAFFVLAAVITPVTIFAMRRSRLRRERKSQAEFDRLDAATDEIDDHALGKLVSFNFRLMDRFINVALGQARMSYIFCAVAASASLFVLLAGTSAILASASTDVRVTVGVLTAAGVTLGSFLCATFMRSFAMTSRQMSYYYGQPLVHCYLLHAEWLAERAVEGLDKASAARIQEHLIHATLGASKNAQMHLLDLQFHGPKRRPDEQDQAADQA
ncbi:hypothetical protein ACQEVZ_03670 [Dactylosporangium sp. CA-152071]|uniref:hypothetical protein n=1 Tax=Dactylosporangium sp. CA-152071 TaxID=3239933 RepID=UPI003D9245D8